jgi:hypothetical protein
VSNKSFSALDSLSLEAKKYFAPLPIPFDPELPGYKNINHAMAGKIMFLPQAQAVKDATMGWFICSNFNKGSVFLHFNGAYHSNNYEGISWYLKKYKSDIRILTINVVEQENFEKVEKDNLNTADFIIVVDNDMTKTY